MDAKRCCPFCVGVDRTIVRSVFVSHTRSSNMRNVKACVDRTVHSSVPFRFTGRVSYPSPGLFQILMRANETNDIKVSKIGFIAGGTGITPIYGVINKIFKNKEDKTKVNLMFANRSIEDILLRDELERMRNERSDTFDIHFVVNSVRS